MRGRTDRIVDTVDNDFLLAVSSGIFCRHLRHSVNACKNTEDINDRKGLRGLFVTSLLT